MRLLIVYLFLFVSFFSIESLCISFGIKNQKPIVFQQIDVKLLNRGILKLETTKVKAV